MVMKRLLLAAAILISPAAVLAADLKAPQPVINAIAPAAFSWTGFYLGGNVGEGFTKGDFNTSADPINLFGFTSLTIGTPNPSVPMKGFVGGVQAGYNYEFANLFVIGLEGDIDWAGLNGTSSNSWSLALNPPGIALSLNSSAMEKIDWAASARARLGFTPVQNLLLYGTGGWAVADVSASYAISTGITGIPGIAGCPIFCGGSSVSSTRSGWAAGAGMEYAVTKNWLVKAEWIHYDFGTVGGAFQTTGLVNLPMTVHWSTKVDMDVARVGFNWKFP